MKMIKKITALLSAMAVLGCFSLTAFADDEQAQRATTSQSSSETESSSEVSDSENSSMDESSNVDESSSESDDTSSTAQNAYNNMLMQYFMQQQNNNNGSSIPDYINDSYYDTEGNASLVKEQKIIHDSAEMQFISVTTKNGNVFYILIDYTAIASGNVENSVYFLNNVRNTYGHYKLLE